ncbi:hypothetical protein RJ639_039805 [Escallonia herrerae]|uniref:RING-type E3 ubiquitin transferase n=1 Tax=Escallonia herrerae TaxID=1293975 RepID=A0AA89BCS6_9ASTE|nr:hypothetical protein RJ639_039805 [Escallonia herrerae]
MAGPRRTIGVRYATATSTSPANPIAPTGFAWILISDDATLCMKSDKMGGICMRSKVRLFRSNCILQFWNHGPAFQPCTCPLCCRQITLLVSSDASSRLRNDSEVSEILGKVEAYNRRFGLRTNGLSQRLQDLPFLLRWLLREMLNPQRSLPLVVKARVFLAVKYITQQDIIPEGILLAVAFISKLERFGYNFLSTVFSTAIFGIIGLLDDLVIVLVCFFHVAALYRSVLLYRHGGS